MSPYVMKILLLLGAFAIEGHGARVNSAFAVEASQASAGSYLGYLFKVGDSFKFRWSADPVENALATLTPGEGIVEKLIRWKRLGQNTPIKRQVTAPHDFFTGLTSFFRFARRNGVMVTMLRDDATIVIWSGETGNRAELPGVGQPFDITQVRLIGAAEGGTDKLNDLPTMSFMNKGMFTGAIIKIGGAYVSLEGLPVLKPATDSLGKPASVVTPQVPVKPTVQAETATVTNDSGKHLGYLFKVGDAFKFRWSADPVENALATLTPGEGIIEKLTRWGTLGQNTGIKVQVTAPHDFFTGFTSFFRFARRNGVMVTMLGDDATIAVWNGGSSQVELPGVGQPFDITQVELIGAAEGGTDKLNDLPTMSFMNKGMFTGAIMKMGGAYVSLEGMKVLKPAPGYEVKYAPVVTEEVPVTPIIPAGTLTGTDDGSTHQTDSVDEDASDVTPEVPSKPIVPAETLTPTPKKYLGYLVKAGVALNFQWSDELLPGALASLTPPEGLIEKLTRWNSLGQSTPISEDPDFFVGLTSFFRYARRNGVMVTMLRDVATIAVWNEGESGTAVELPGVGQPFNIGQVKMIGAAEPGTDKLDDLPKITMDWEAFTDAVLAGGGAFVSLEGMKVMKPAPGSIAE